jgi:streptogramin lyase
MSRLKRAALSLVLVVALGASSIACRAAIRIAAAAAVVGAVTAARVAVVALTLATWYAITRPVYVYYRPGAAHYYHMPAGTRLYIISRSADGHWYYVRTSDGRHGWVPARSLRGCHRV